jgi:hypothetical protein
MEELAPAMQQFAVATGVLWPVQELSAWAADLIRYRRAAHQARLLMCAAEKIKASGLPPCGVEDKLLRAVLEDGAMEDDDQRQERWANLLANAGTENSAPVSPSYPAVLRQLEAAEAMLLDLVVSKDSSRSVYETSIILSGDIPFEWKHIDNLARLGLIEGTGPTETYRAPKPTDQSVRATEYAAGMVRACRTPSSS